MAITVDQVRLLVASLDVAVQVVQGGQHDRLMSGNRAGFNNGELMLANWRALSLEVNTELAAITPNENVFVT